MSAAVSVPGRVARTLLALACAAVLVAGCSDDSTPRTEEKAPTGSSTTTAPTAQESVPQRPLPAKPISNVVAKRAAVRLTECRAAPAGWRAVGTVSNETASPKTYRITVFFTSEAATVMDYARATVRVDAGQTRRWQVIAKFSAPDEANCVLRGVG